MKSHQRSRPRISVVALATAVLATWSPGTGAQAVDSVSVSGSVEWVNESIDHFPDRVVIQSRYDPTFVRAVPVDTAGTYTAMLPAGSYRIRPFSTYHWQRDWDQGFVRIDESTSFVDAELSAGPPAELPALALDTLGHADRLPEEGILLGPFGREEADALDAFVTDNLSYYGVPGASLAIIKDGAVLYARSYGVENPLTDEPVDETTLFEAGSITKPVFAFAVMRLVERGLLDLDRPLYEYLPFDDVAHDDRYKRITARHVLSHQTGFPNWAERDSTGRFDLLFTPGTQFGYSGEGFEYLKRVVVHLLDKDIEAVLQDELIVPLGLEGFHFHTTDYVRAHATDGFYRGEPSRTRHVEEPMMAYSLMTNAGYFTAFALALRDRDGLSEATYDEMFRSQVEVNDEISRGLGFELREDEVGAFYGHTGITRDFASIYRYYPDLDVGFVFFVNNITGGWLALNTLKQFLVTGKP